MKARGIKEVFSISKKRLIVLMIICLQLLLAVAVGIANTQLDYGHMSIMAIGQTVLNVILLKLTCDLPIISLPNFFGFVSMVFHCGQLIKEGFSIDGAVPLPFENYGDILTIQKSFFFYFLSQAMYFITILLMRGRKGRIETWEAKNCVDIYLYGKILIAIGIIPRMCIDFVSVSGARMGGYEAVYSLYFPQPIQSMAFFFDVGMFFFLFASKNTKRQSIVFWGMIFYKCFIMTSGSRQDKVAFLLVWIYVYFFITKRITVRKILVLGTACVGGFWFISAIGAIRTADVVEISQVMNLLQSGTMTNVFGGALGEFGAAFNTLEVAVKYTPDYIDYGYGRSYIAGILSIIPFLVSRIPVLSETVVFLDQLPRSITFAFGGSYLGELYYNFSWFGVLGSIGIGAFMIKLHDGLVSQDDMGDVYKVWCAIVATAMILYVRGYFADMVQKLVWTYILINLIYLYSKRKRDF